MTLIARSDDLRRENQRRVLAALRADSPLSRTELAAATGLSASTVTTITSSLLAADYLVEAPRKDGGTGEEEGMVEVDVDLAPPVFPDHVVPMAAERYGAGEHH